MQQEPKKPPKNHTYYPLTHKLYFWEENKQRYYIVKKKKNMKTNLKCPIIGE